VRRFTPPWARGRPRSSVRQVELPDGSRCPMGRDARWVEMPDGSSCRKVGVRLGGVVGWSVAVIRSVSRPATAAVSTATLLGVTGVV